MKGKKETKKTEKTGWIGLWRREGEDKFYSSAFAIDNADTLRDGARIFVMKNKYHAKNSENEPEYVFCINSKTPNTGYAPKVRQVQNDPRPYKENGMYFDENGNRLYTHEDACRIIYGAFDDFEYGITDPGDVLPEDFIL